MTWNIKRKAWWNGNQWKYHTVHDASLWDTELALLQVMFHGPSLAGAASPIACPQLGRHPPRAELGEGPGALGQGVPGQGGPGAGEASRPVPPNSRPPPAQGLGLGRTGAAAGPGRGQGTAASAEPGTEGTAEGPAGSPSPPSGSGPLAVPMATAGGAGNVPPLRPGVAAGRTLPCPARAWGRLIVTLPRAG